MGILISHAGVFDTGTNSWAFYILHENIKKIKVVNKEVIPTNICVSSTFKVTWKVLLKYSMLKYFKSCFKCAFKVYYIVSTF